MDTDKIITGDCLDILSTTPYGTAALAFADPPFNIGVKYPGYNDRKKPGDYLAWLKACLAALSRVLSPVGSLVVAIGPEYLVLLRLVFRLAPGKTKDFPLGERLNPGKWLVGSPCVDQHCKATQKLHGVILGEVCVMLKDLGLHWRNTIVWHYTFGEHQKHKFTPSWTALLYFVANPKKNRYTFNRDYILVTSARMLADDKRLTDNTRRGKTPDDVWFLRPQDAEAEGYFDPAGDVWHVRREAGTFEGREDHVVQMRLAVMERIIRALSNPGDLVLDPFCGAGTTLVAAKRLGRRYLGIELCEQTAELARRRLQETRAMPVSTPRAVEFPRPTAAAEDAQANGSAATPSAPEEGFLF
jgi:site-specific DNA-methyltransferase (adenine-specific)